jgi:Tol biopolymer transport system component
MKNIFRIVLLATLSGGLLLAQNVRTPEVLFKAAQNKEQVEGDLKGAIEQYKQIAGGKDRAIAAKALVAMAECYQKLGDVEARLIYERVLRDYADQTESAALARAYLGRTDAATASAGMTTRRLWTLSGNAIGVYGTISPDGRLLTYEDLGTGDLFVHELATGRDRRLTNTGTRGLHTAPEYAEVSAISRDGKQVAYTWYRITSGIGGTEHTEIRVASLESTGVPQSRLLFVNEDVGYVGPYDWSPDGNWIAVELKRNDHTNQMGLISVRDGSLRVLKSADWQGATKMFFSPDGKYLGFDAPVGQSGSDQRDVFILAVDGSRQIPAVVGPSNDTMMGWSPDGKHLLFASDRGATIGLWAVAIADGRPQGPPALMKSDISRGSLGVSASGSLYTRVALTGRDIQVATVDFETGKLVSQPINPANSFMGFSSNPEWSPDGKYLSYVSNRSQAGGNQVIEIWSAETGQTREIEPRLINKWRNPYWARDGQSLILDGHDLKNQRGMYRINAQTGEATLIVTGGTFVQWSPDGTRFYYQKNLGTDGISDGNVISFGERDLASGKEREIIRGKDLGNLSLSPDGRSIATIYNDRSTKSTVLLLIPVSGGEPRELLRVSQPPLLGPVSWMPDGRGILTAKTSGAGSELWSVPIDGGQPRKIDMGVTNFGGFKVHPDGKQIAYLVGENKEEVWVLENFLPALNAKR